MAAAAVSYTSVYSLLGFQMRWLHLQLNQKQLMYVFLICCIVKILPICKTLSFSYNLDNSLQMLMLPNGISYTN